LCHQADVTFPQAYVADNLLRFDIERRRIMPFVRDLRDDQNEMWLKGAWQCHRMTNMH
jgi:hypothetical protein